MPNASHFEPLGQVDLAFSDWRPLQHLKDPLHKDLSAVARVGNSLFLACDETASVERLRRIKDGRFGEHRHFALDGLIDLPAGAEGEMDIEGLCVVDGFLWIVGSHALKRSKPKRDESDADDALRRMEQVNREPNRHFLGRIPLVEEAPGLFMPTRSNGKRQAAWIKFDKRSSALTRWLAEDPHLGPFLSISAKENGFDVEGLAVRGDRIWLGLRGPVLRGHAVVLDLEIAEKAPGRLKARRIESERRYRKHLLDTRGLGIRDMRFDGDDLLLLVGPTMSLEGPAFVLRWRNAVRDDVSGVIAPDRIETVAELPYRLHADHPEGIDHWPEAGPGGLIVIYDAPAPERTEPDAFTVRADLIGPCRPKVRSRAKRVAALAS
ncbi:DUF3616 domain-containing protein [Microvirga sp. VF16]|uniref:DUF3616 domain-containing protein n=1 Tax=Microvirga sp. VF16 TaxID=2807101 RepID=UPI00193DCBBC|nr:DUF3616 domain-containing protein [Microvirga sp. VF16]QRM27733.1 DUF3616 domain-containing protein [Microvirga sp. VF16]